MPIYLLDSNIFIQAHRMYYPFDVVPSFWNKILELSNKGIICSIDKVRKEICETNNPDSLSKWCENDLSNDFFADSSSAVNFYAKIALWANNSSHFNQAAIDDFLTTDLADPWLIAAASVHGYTIVTEEVKSGGLSKKTHNKNAKIPDVAAA